MAYERINWQNEPSEATALNDVNLNKMDSAIYELDGKATTTETAITNLQNGKVDKVTGQGLSKTNDVQVTSSTNVGTEIATVQIFPSTGGVSGVQIKNGVVVDSALSSSSENPVQNKVVKSAIDGKSTVAISDTLETGTTLANITIDGTTTAIKGSDIEVDEELSPTSTNPVENKAIYDALNNLLPSKTVSGNPISISDASGFNAKALKVTMNPIQDLHGYSNPWAGGAGKNKLKVTATTQTINGVTFTVNSDGTVSLSGTASDTSIFDVATFSAVGGTAYKLSGCPSGGSTTKYLLSIPTVGYDSGSGYNYTPSTSADVLVRITIYSGQNTQGLVFKPMICLASAPNPDYAHYEPYENICPISGRTEASVTRTGKNQCDTSAFGGVSHYTVNTDESITVNSSDTRSWSSVTEIPLKAGTYTVSKSGTTGTSDIRLSTEEFNTGHIFTTSFTFTLATDGSVKIKLAYGGVTYPQTYTLQIESGSTATTYEPYQGETVTVQLGQTVYGGTLDVTNGKLLVDKVLLTFNGNEDWSYTQGAFLLANAFNEPNNTFNLFAQNPKSNKYVAVTRISNVSEIAGIANNSMFNQTGTNYKRLWVKDNSCSTAEAFKTSLATTPLQICYTPLNTTEITLTAERISLLKGNNVLSTNADDMELKYSVSLDSLLTT